MPRPPDRWTDLELSQDAQESLKRHVAERRAATESEHRAYRELVARHTRSARRLLECTRDLSEITGSTLADRNVLEIARYAAVPMISAGDLDNLTDAKFSNWLNQTTSRGVQPSAEAFETAAEIIREALNPLLTPWLIDDREPTGEERERFAFSTALIPAASGLSTSRRNTSAARQEDAIRAACAAAGYEPVAPPGMLSDPIKQMSPGSFSTASRRIAGDNMDVPIRLRSGHHLKFLAIEAKVSNTAVNSRKRLAEVMNKRAHWDAAGELYDYRTAAVLSGDYSIERLEEAQAAGVMIFWEHRLEDLIEFLKG